MVVPNTSAQGWGATSATKRGSGGGAGGIGFNTTTAIVVLVSAIPSFFLGTFLSLYAGITSYECNSGASSGAGDMMQQHQSQQQLLLKQQQLERREQELDAAVAAAAANNNNIKCKEDGGAGGGAGGVTAAGQPPLFPDEGFGDYLVGMAHVSKFEFLKLLDPGTPIDPPDTDGARDVAILYSSPRALPSSIQSTIETSKQLPTTNPRIGTIEEAVENCNQVNLILSDHSGTRKQCFAIMPQYESYHIQKWMRVPDPDTDEGSKLIKDAQRKKQKSFGNDVPLRLVSRGQLETGRDAFKPPDTKAKKEHWELLKVFLANVDAVLAELDPILSKIAKPISSKQTVIVMVCNFGQSELLLNFVCAAKSRNLDISNVIVFTTDEETTQIVQSLGLTAYYDHRNFADIPTDAAKRYGDPKFTAMMMAKVLCVLYVSWLGYDMLFQDVDIVWYKDPLEYFESMAQYDIFFQDDGGHSLRYAPYSANSGFYFVRHNERTRHFLTSLLMAGGDLVLSTKSHQQALIALLQEHVSLHGLKAKVLSRDMEEFPGGFQFNQKTGKYMKALFAGELHPYIFHMSWTLNKDNKLLYFRQMGEWYVQDKCIGKNVGDIMGVKDNIEATDIRLECCSADPLVSCHYRDKPSKIPCKDSPPIDKGRPSFWR